MIAHENRTRGSKQERGEANRTLRTRVLCSEFVGEIYREKRPTHRSIFFSRAKTLNNLGVYQSAGTTLLLLYR